jgi:acyl transferase domain-containing protein
MSAKEAEVTDPQQRLFLETCWHALENAGYDPDRAKGLIGIYAGVGINTYQHQQVRTRPDIVDLVGEEVIILGNEKDYLATRIAYKLNLHGPALNVNTACSTALVAVGQACQALLHFQCDLALAGGVSVTFPQKRGTVHQEGGFASSDGHTRTFDAQARGTVFSDGLGVVALKRLADAIEDGDQIIAVVKGVGLNNDGSDKVGFTAPSIDGQAEAIALAQADAGFDPDSISYVECHGTATPIGDPIEIAALTQAFRLRTSRKNFCAIGSVKSNIGHLGAAAGAAGLIKTALALKNKVLPPSLHYTAPNPKLDFASSPFFVNTKLTDWKSGNSPRRAGVSAFGFGGTNAHVVLEEAPELAPSSDSRDWQLLVLSAKSPAALDAATANLAAHLKAQPDLNLADVAYTLEDGRRRFEHRRIVVCRDTADAVQALEKRDPKRILSFEHDEDSDEPSVVFMFPGQGSQYVGMAADLYRTEPLFKEQVDRCAQILRPSLGLDLRDVLYPTPDKAKAAEELLLQTRITQPALFVIEYALAQLWISWGIKPAAFTGHSLGEYVAACLAGVFTLEDALGLVAQRGHLIQSLPRGSMLAVPMTEDELKKILPPTLSIAGINGPAQCVVSGPSSEIDAFLATLAADGNAGRPLHTSHAFHSAMMDPVLQPFADCVRRVKRGEPSIPFISNLTGTWISPDDARDPQYWARHLRQGVRFADGIRELLKNKAAVFLEVGPGTTLGSLARSQAMKADNRAVLSSLRHAREEQPDLAAMLNAMGQLWMRGVTADWAAYYSAERRHRVALPGYAFQRERYWVERGVPELPAARPATVSVRKNSDIAEWFYVPSWKRSAPLPRSQPAGEQPDWLIFADEEGLAASVAERLALVSRNIIIVRVGQRFAAASEGFVIDPAAAGDYEKLIGALQSSGRVPQRIAHFWGVTGETPGPDALPRERQLGLDSLLFLAQAIHKRGLSGMIQLNLVANHTQVVTGGEPLAPGKAMVQVFQQRRRLPRWPSLGRSFRAGSSCEAGAENDPSARARRLSDHRRPRQDRPGSRRLPRQELSRAAHSRRAHPPAAARRMGEMDRRPSARGRDEPAHRESPGARGNGCRSPGARCRRWRQGPASGGPRWSPPEIRPDQRRHPRGGHGRSSRGGVRLRSDAGAHRHAFPRQGRWPARARRNLPRRPTRLLHSHVVNFDRARRARRFHLRGGQPFHGCLCAGAPTAWRRRVDHRRLGRLARGKAERVQHEGCGHRRVQP